VKLFKNQEFKFLYVFLFLFAGSTLRADDTIFPDANHPANEGYQGVVWSVALKDFQHTHGAMLFHPLPVERAALNDLLMTLHPYDSAKLHNLDKSRILRVPGDLAHYVFYNERFCMASLPVSLSDLNKVQAFLKTHFKSMGSTTLRNDRNNPAVPGHNKSEFSFQRYDTQEFDDNYLMNKTGTRAYLISFSESNPKLLKAVYLVYVSTDYFTGGNNAFSENQ
jgi:hypothetical protein